MDAVQLSNLIALGGRLKDSTQQLVMDDLGSAVEVGGSLGEALNAAVLDYIKQLTELPQLANPGAIKSNAPNLTNDFGSLMSTATINVPLMDHAELHEVLNRSTKAAKAGNWREALTSMFAVGKFIPLP